MSVIFQPNAIFAVTPECVQSVTVRGNAEEREELCGNPVNLMMHLATKA